METYLAHHGILGQKWGIRRYQNEDGTLTPAGKKRKYYLDPSIYYMEGKEKTKKGVSAIARGASIGAATNIFANELAFGLAMPASMVSAAGAAVAIPIATIGVGKLAYGAYLKRVAKKAAKERAMLDA